MKTQYIDVEALRALLASEAICAVLDVRERGEFALRQIPGTIPLPRGTLEYRALTMLPRRDVPIVTLSKSERRAMLAAATLRALGYSDVRVLRGGLSAWVAAGGPVQEGWGVSGKAYGERVLVDAAVPQVTADDLAARRDGGEPVTVIDVRTEEEFARGHVPGAYHIPGGNLPLEAPWLLERLDSPVVISCAGRTRGILGAQMLREAGFSNVAALENGAMGWRLSGRALEEGGGRGRPASRAGGPGEEIAAATRRLAQGEGLPTMDLAALDALGASNAPHYLVDVRLPDEYRAGHVPGSVNLPAGQLALHYENNTPLHQATVVVLADDAVRPIWAAALYRRLGFRQVYVLEGGLAAWTGAGRELEAGAGIAEALGLAEARRRVPGITPGVLVERQRGTRAPLLLDVRGSGDFGMGHLPGARWLTRGKLELDVERMVPDRSTPLVTYCDNGVRAALAAATLRDLGYANTAYLEGGLQSWGVAVLPLVEGLDGADVTVAEAQADHGHTVWSGALGRTRADMEHYLSWEEELAHKPG
jgi:rhodanese-related sulfurtransferase